MSTRNIDTNASAEAPAVRPTVNHRRRIRPPVSCLPCRRRKVKCDRQLPCSQCDRLGRATRCVYSEKRNRNFELSLGPELSAQNSPTEPMLDRAQLPAANTARNGSAPQGNIPAANSHGFSRDPVLLSVITQPADGSQVWQMPYSIYGGRSHWSWLLPRFSGLLPFVDQAGYHDNDSNRILYKDAKSKIKNPELFTPYDPIDLGAILSELPSRESAVAFAKLYFSTFERLWRILHIPSFFSQLAKIWQYPGAVSTSFAIQILLVVLIGNSMLTPSSQKLSFDTTLRFWNTALSWRSAAALIKDPDMQSIQTDALMLLAKRIYRFTTPVSAITSSNLIRNAMLLGLHREPSIFNHFSTAEMEIRRRLWYTVLEIGIVQSIDSGMPLSIEESSWDTLYPSAIMDDELNIQGIDLSSNLSFSEGSITAAGLAALAKSTSLRMRIVNAVNKIDLTLSYEDVIRFGTELRMERESFHDSLSKSNSPGATEEINAIVRDLGDLLFERMTFLLHKPFSIKFSPHYEFSEYTCLSTALCMLKKLCRAPQDVSTHELGQHSTGSLSPLADAGGSFFDGDALNAALLICLFLIRDAKSSRLGTALAGPPLQSACVAQLQNFIEAARRRLLLPYPSGKAFIIPSMTLEYMTLVNSNVTDSELPGKLEAVGQQVAQTALTLFLKQPGSVMNHVTDAETIVETTSYLF